MINKILLKETCLKYDIVLSDEQIQILDEFSKMIIEWNKKFNLTAITSPDEMVYKHFVDSLLVFKAIDLNLNASLMDIGAGAGFPSTPIAIVRNDISITQLDSLKKRVTFLQKVNDCLKLKAKSFHARAEEFAKKAQYRELFDYVTARAVASMTKLSEYCLPFAKVGGFFIAMKGPEYEPELDQAKRAIKVLGGRIEKIKTFKLPNSSVRNIILVKKISQTPTKYPRTPGKISKSPI